MILQCVLVGQKIFPTRDDVKLDREKSFRNSPAACSEKIFRGLVWHHRSLKISFGLHEHTVMMPHDMSFKKLKMSNKVRNQTPRKLFL